MSDYIQDKQVFIPEPMILNIGSKEFNISKVPFEFSLRFYELLDVFNVMSEGKFITNQDFQKIFIVIYDLLKFIDDTTEERWLRNEITMQNFSYIMTTISAAVFYDGKKKEAVQADATEQSTSAESSAV
jgi:hypothetical protein